MPDIGKAYVQIIPKAEGIGGKIKASLGGEMQAAGSSAGESLGGELVSKLKGVIAAAGIGAVIKQTLDAGGALQQSFGGIDTLYGDATNAANDASEAMKKYAYEAQAAGISANDYAEQAVSFGAGLKQAFGGDNFKAMESANTAILDMADNAAKMGTPLESIQNAYQGFAKNNYTMLDNLKLGYGGTKAEMERLLADAQELSGVEYDMENLGDVYEAIHVVQESLGLTGVAAEEASGTFTGSMGAMQAAAQNLMANLALGEDIEEPLNQLIGNTTAFIVNNLAPMIGHIIEALPSLLDQLLKAVGDIFQQATANMPDIVTSGMNIVISLAKAITDNLPTVIAQMVSFLAALAQQIISYDWIGAANTMVSNLGQSISEFCAEWFGNPDTLAVVKNIADGITQRLPDLLAKGVEVVTNIANGILQNIPQLITTVGNMLLQATNFMLQNAPEFMKAGIELMVNLATGLVNNLPNIISAIAGIIAGMIKSFLDALPKFIEVATEMLATLANGLIAAIPIALAAIIQLLGEIVAKLLDYDWIGLGGNILDGIGQGFLNATDNLIKMLWGAVDGAIKWVKDKLGIKSPSRLMADLIGKNMALGIGMGFEDNMPDMEISTTVRNSALMASRVVSDVTPQSNVGVDYKAIYAAVKAGAEAANLQIDIDGRELSRQLRRLGVAF